MVVRRLAPGLLDHHRADDGVPGDEHLSGRHVRRVVRLHGPRHDAERHLRGTAPHADATYLIPASAGP
ncbi:hypothetical protein [Streptomyces sp. NPDC088766]|uniref:hypothetical protein n=1 Tax=Streptomyces sp. NPDC088766 TaxID=3365893 RepID=UPI00380FD665